MTDESEPTELSPEEQEAFTALSRERQPPDDLEDRVVAALESRRLVRSIPPGRQRSLVRFAAAAVTLLAMGFLAGRFAPQQTSGTTAESARFMLLLYDAPEREAARSPERNRELAAEYGAWAQQIGEAGHFLGGDSLRLDGRLLRRVDERIEAGPEASAAGEVVVGYFMIQARDYEQAMEIAEDCPHLKYQGSVLVRPVGHG